MRKGTFIHIVSMKVPFLIPFGGPPPFIAAVGAQGRRNGERSPCRWTAESAAA